ncbi:MAG: type I DNA topoisomerase, partial [Oscillospiraceae bacterium]|nr:type I DNA topoisomerase [Oscillospiraceae bacterium]
TYMRTDSLRLSEEALSAARSYIREHYGESYLPAQARRYKTKAGAQDAHEAIRPTDVRLSPELVRKDLTAEQYRLYRLIWGRFTACQMSNAVYDNISVDVGCAGYTFRANYSELKFPGYTAVYEEAKDEESNEISSPLPSLNEGEELILQKMIPDQQFTQPPARYTEATLIRAMEEKGIGRPSTYAPTITTITAHDYVVKEGKYLRPTPLGEIVTELMKEHFADIVDLRFTNHMEAELDEIEQGRAAWRAVLQEFYEGFHREMETAEKELDGVRIKVPDVLSDEFCEVCGRQMVVKKGRFGQFLACPGFPECTFTKPIVVEMPGKCPKCGSKILKRTSKKGYVFYACERGTECGFITWDVPTKDFCPSCGKTLFKRSGRGALKPFCENEECVDFVPEDKRGYKRKSKPAEGAETGNAADAESGTATDAEPGGKSARKSAASKKTAAARKPAAKKTATKRAPAGRSTATMSEETETAKAGKKTATKSAAAKKSTGTKAATAGKPTAAKAAATRSAAKKSTAAAKSTAKRSAAKKGTEPSEQSQG